MNNEEKIRLAKDYLFAELNDLSIKLSNLYSENIGLTHYLDYKKINFNVKLIEKLNSYLGNRSMLLKIGESILNIKEKSDSDGLLDFLILKEKAILMIEKNYNEYNEKDYRFEYINTLGNDEPREAYLFLSILTHHIFKKLKLYKDSERAKFWLDNNIKGTSDLNLNKILPEFYHSICDNLPKYEIPRTLFDSINLYIEFYDISLTVKEMKTEKEENENEKLRTFLLKKTNEVCF